ncbi:cytosolic phospholipase A2 gamma-like isoform X1 [Megalobrama amblycephala]|uniref:cytosolic phospholipase A2 gamma-like isoform X1 n=2 Tax=Megalobrama amblycephala TaxID=75352 RepID=UPI0020142618|nr:cytosolic phospholipase A2 gamma-like isoform X1 [Megalobrama amblycephala]
MPTTMLGLLGVLLCALAVSSDVTPQPDFNIKRMAGKWYLIGIATSDEWFVNCKANLKMGVAMLTPTDEGDLEMAYSSLNPDGTCWRMNQFVNKSDFPGIFSFHSERWETYNITFVDVKYDEYALIHTLKTKNGSTTVLSKLYGRTPDLSQVVLDKFTEFSLNQSILPENITILPKNGFDHQHTAATSIPGGFTPEKVVTPEVEKICLEMSASKLQESEVRIKHSLNKNEEEFRIRRRNTVQQCLQKLGIHCSLNDVPNIALLGSGGGQRAMVGLLGSVVQLHKVGLLDSILYLSGVSGSTWCMASLYQEADWSTKLETVKDKIIQRLSGPKVSWTDAFAKLKKYYNEKDHFSLTDFWAAMVVTTYVKEIDEHTLTEQWNQQSKDPFPIYTMIDKQSKQKKEADPWFEFTPHEAGYSLIGAFLGVSNFGSQFKKGSMMKKEPEIDMLYLQALCGSALADGEEIVKFIWQKIKDFFQRLFTQIKKMLQETGKDPDSPPADKFCQVLLDLVDMNLYVLDGKDPSALDESIRTTLTDLAGGEGQLIFPVGELNLTDKEAAKLYMERYTMDVSNNLSVWFKFWPFDLCLSIIRSMAMWIWGRKYDFLHIMTDEPVPIALLESETRDFIDAGLLLNSPYFSVLRKDRKVDLIISLDFSDGDPFMTVKKAAEMCREQNIPFPEVNIPSEDLEKPKDFYVFKGQNVPTVIHIPLFNVVNCGDKIEDWRSKYKTFQGSYSAEMITDLMDVAGKNIANNKENLKKVIRAIVEQKQRKAYTKHDSDVSKYRLN